MTFASMTMDLGTARTVRLARIHELDLSSAPSIDGLWMANWQAKASWESPDSAAILQQYILQQ